MDIVSEKRGGKGALNKGTTQWEGLGAGPRREQRGRAASHVAARPPFLAIDNGSAHLMGGRVCVISWGVNDSHLYMSTETDATPMPISALSGCTNASISSLAAFAGATAGCPLPDALTSSEEVVQAMVPLGSRAVLEQVEGRTATGSWVLPLLVRPEEHGGQYRALCLDDSPTGRNGVTAFLGVAAKDVFEGPVRGVCKVQYNIPAGELRADLWTEPALPRAVKWEWVEQRLQSGYRLVLLVRLCSVNGQVGFLSWETGRKTPGMGGCNTGNGFEAAARAGGNTRPRRSAGNRIQLAVHAHLRQLADVKCGGKGDGETPGGAALASGSGQTGALGSAKPSLGGGAGEGQEKQGREGGRSRQELSDALDELERKFKALEKGKEKEQAKVPPKYIIRIHAKARKLDIKSSANPGGVVTLFPTDESQDDNDITGPSPCCGKNARLLYDLELEVQETQPPSILVRARVHLTAPTPTLQNQRTCSPLITRARFGLVPTDPDHVRLTRPEVETGAAANPTVSMADAESSQASAGASASLFPPNVTGQVTGQVGTTATATGSVPGGLLRKEESVVGAGGQLKDFIISANLGVLPTGRVFSIQNAADLLVRPEALPAEVWEADLRGNVTLSFPQHLASEEELLVEVEMDMVGMAQTRSGGRVRVDAFLVGKLQVVVNEKVLNPPEQDVYIWEGPDDEERAANLLAHGVAAFWPQRRQQGGVEEGDGAEGPHLGGDEVEGQQPGLPVAHRMTTRGAAREAEQSRDAAHRGTEDDGAEREGAPDDVAARAAKARESGEDDEKRAQEATARKAGEEEAKTAQEATAHEASAQGHTAAHGAAQDDTTARGARRPLPRGKAEEEQTARVAAQDTAERQAAVGKGSQKEPAAHEAQGDLAAGQAAAKQSGTEQATGPGGRGPGGRPKGSGKGRRTGR